MWWPSRLYGADFAEDYEITERLGVGLAIPLATAQGEHELSFAIFNADRTFLSESLGENRGRTKLSDGGVSNTGNPESISVSMSGVIGDMSYNLGAQYQAAGRGDAEDQTGVVAGISHGFPAGSLPLTALAELAYFNAFDGTNNSASYATVGVEAPVGPVTFSAVYGMRDVEALSTDHLATIAGEMEVAEGLFASLAYRYGDEGGDETHTIGALVAYEF